MKRFAVLMLLATMTHGCGSAADHEEQNASDLHFITFGPNVSGLVGRVKQRQLAVCLSGVAEGDRKAWGEQIQSTILKWVTPLRALTSAPLFSSVSIVGGSERCDADVVGRSGTHANTSIGSRPTVRMDVEGYFASYNVLLHEMGHAFALSDTYQNGRSGDCVAGQPQAIMCNTSFSELQRDDIAGVTRIFKQTFPNDTPGTTPPADTNADFAKMKFAAALGKEVATDGYQIAVGMSGAAEQAGATLGICFGAEAACRASESGWRDLKRLERRGDATIFQDSEVTTAQNALSFTVRYKNANAVAYGSFTFRNVSAGQP